MKYQHYFPCSIKSSVISPIFYQVIILISKILPSHQSYLQNSTKSSALSPRLYQVINPISQILPCHQPYPQLLPYDLCYIPGSIKYQHYLPGSTKSSVISPISNQVISLISKILPSHQPYLPNSTMSSALSPASTI